MKRSTISCTLHLILMLWMFSSTAYGQKKPNAGGKVGNAGIGKKEGKEKSNEVQIQAEVRQVTEKGLVVADERKKNYLIAFHPQSEVLLEGVASKEFLQSGTTMEFQVDMHRDGRIMKPIQTMTIVDLSILNPAGLFPTTLPEAAEKSATTSLLMRGRVEAVKKDLLTIQAGRRELEVKVTNEVSLEARLASWNMASVGDRVSGSIEVPLQVQTGLLHAMGKRIHIKSSQVIRPPKGRREVDPSKVTSQ